MASSTFLEDLEENFFLCPVCLEQFNVPKMLPCLHRYCSNCLTTVVNRSNDGTIKCPICKQQFTVPDNGIDGFKTDFHMRNVVEFIQLQKAFEDKNVKECVSCSKQSIVSTYCFKCKDFLCEQCYNVHITNKMFTDHKSRTLKLDNTEGRNITLEKLATLTENPRCRIHVEKNAELCCSTCVNEPICMVCTYSKHKGHDLHDVTELASTERELLEAKIAELRKLTCKFYELPKNVEATRQQLNKNISMKTDKIVNQHKHQVDKVKNQLEVHKHEKEQGLADIERRRKDEEKQTNLKYQEEINELNKKYDKIKKATARKYNNESQQFEGGCDKIVTELVHRLKTLDDHLKTLTESKKRLMEKKNTELTKISESCHHVFERYQNFTAIASSILASDNKWAQVQSIPDIRAACEPLIEEMRREYPQLDSLSDINIKDMPNIAVAEVTISEQEQSVVDVEGLKSIGGCINGIAISRNGTIVISGHVSKDCSHITVINRKGRVQRQDQIKRVKECDLYPTRYCCYLSEFKVATVCIPDEIGIYDVRDGSHNKKYISNVIRGWSANRFVWCVTDDPVKNHIIVGTYSRYVYVFDDQLNYIRTITLPDVIKKVNDISVHARTLLVCDYDGKRAYSVNMEGPESKLMYEFTKPDIGTNVGPYRVCSDKNDFIYMLWRDFISLKLACTLVQYRQDGRRIMTTRKVDNDAYCLATVGVDESENLLIATYSSGKLYEYRLTVK